MTHEDFLEQLATVLSDAEPGGGAATLLRLDAPARSHLAACAACGSLARGLTRGGGALFGDEPPAGYRESFSRSLASRLEAEGLRTRGQGGAHPGRRWLLLAAAVVLAVTSGLALRNGLRSQGGVEPEVIAAGVAPAPTAGEAPESTASETDAETLAAASLDAAFGRTTFLDSLDDNDDTASGPDWDSLDRTSSPLLSGEALHLLGDTLEAGLDAEAAAELARRIREDMTS